MPHTGRFRATLLTMTALAAGLLAASPARAQGADQQINAIQRQIQALQRELTQMKHNLAGRDAAVRAAQSEAARARQDALAAQQAVQRIPVNPFPPPPPGAVGPGGVTGFITTPQGIPSLGSSSPAIITSTSPRPIFQVGAVTVSLGGFVELAGIFRSRNEVTSVGSNFSSGIPLNNLPQAHQGEFRFTGQQSRVSALVQGQPDEFTKLAGYVEVDFLGAAPTANSNESNSYTPRMRVFYGTYDRSDLNFHLLFGQAWSLLTMDKIGIVPRQENIPLTIDAQYVPGFTWKRTPQIRVAGDFLNHTVWLGASLENPESTYSIGPNGTGSPAGTTVTTTLPGLSQLNPTATYASNVAPDIILKAAFEPGYGHYEVYGLGRILRDRISMVGSGNNLARFGGGGGAGFIIPLLHNTVQLQGSFLAGAGIGTYGSSQLPDATVGIHGEPVPIPEVEALVGVIGHPSKSVDLYAYVGTEQQSRKSFEVGGKGFGVGSPLYVNSGCGTELSALVCSPANTSGVVQGTIGEWWRWVSGPWGSMALGAQYSYTRRQIFKGVGGSPRANENIFMLSLRYYPFQ
jgi:hypothetical protein